MKSIYEDRSGVLWLGTGGSGLISFDHGVVNRITPADGLPDPVIMTSYEDREGSFWLGTGTHGINRMTKKAVTVYSSRDGLSGDSTHAMIQDRSGDIWVGASGLNRLQDGRWTSFGKNSGLRFYNVTALAEDRERRLWIGGAGGLSCLRGGKFVDFSDRLGLKVGDYNVWVIHQDRGGRLWFATDRGLALYENDTFKLLTTGEGLAGDDIKAILEDRNGSLWFGTYSGLSVLKNGRFNNLTEAEGLSSNRVRSLYEDGAGTLWIGTYDGGLNRLKDGKLAKYTTGDGLFNNGVFQILEDESGNFWMSSNLGIYRTSKQELEDFADRKRPSINCVSFGRQDGLVNVECNGGQQPAGMKTRDGRLWFPTQLGVAVIDPRSVPINQQPPPVAIESCLLDRATIDVDGPVKITPGKESLEIRYAGLSFIKPERVRFKYKLEGLDHDWVDAGTRRDAFYSHLPPGSYVFKVIAANSDGIWNTEGRSLEIVVIPPFWRTWWFMLTAISVVVAVAAAAYRSRVSRLEKANALQRAFSRQLIESQESERKRIAAELHDSLGQRLIVIKNLALLGLRQTHDTAPIRRNVDEISAETSQAINEVKEISYNLRPYQLDRIGLTKAIEAIVNKARLSTDIDFSATIDELEEVFSKEAEINLYRIIQESVNNVVKHSQATAAAVAVEVSPSVLEVSVSDNGTGFPTATPAHSPSGGFGLIGIAERVRMLGGMHTIHSTPGHGTRLTIRIAL
ncbi:MAG TPA: two-component regulator propeller domain-containing protein, partial [Blastocatellia bacterium]|nr:two-component regulator propeller domain-containing protein [Blastocatellia bacterium]